MSLPMLENLKIAKPCPANWDAMTGDERVRFCGQCKLHVYNLSGMTRDQAEDLLTKREGSICVRLYQRADGTVLTQDCPVGLAAIRRRVATLTASLFALVAVSFSSFFKTGDGIDGSKLETTTTTTTTTTKDPETTDPRVEVPKPERVLMGAVPAPRRDPEPETPPPAREGWRMGDVKEGD